VIIAHFADLHLKARTNPYQQTLAEQVDGLVWAAEDARQHGAELALVAGDVFDGAEGPGSPAIASERNAAIEVFSALAKIGDVIVVRGNHDAPGELDFLRLIPGVSVIDSYGRRRLNIYGATVDIDAIAWPQKRWLADRAQDTGLTTGELAADAMRALLRGISCRDPDTATIVVAHAEVAEAVFDNGQPATGRCDIPITPGDLLDTGADYVALGHYHCHQVIHDRIVYAGAPRQLTFADEGARGYVLADVGAGRAPTIEHRTIPGPSMLTAEMFRLLDPGQGFGLDMVANPLPGDVVRIVYTAPSIEREAWRGGAENWGMEMIARGARTVKIDGRVEAEERVRSEAIKTARTDLERLEAYWAAESRPDGADRIVEKLGEITE
jgi:DNA repair exonuclease SbcCD nuclease subunit